MEITRGFNYSTPARKKGECRRERIEKLMRRESGERLRLKKRGSDTFGDERTKKGQIQSQNGEGER